MKVVLEYFYTASAIGGLVSVMPFLTTMIGVDILPSPLQEPAQQSILLNVLFLMAYLAYTQGFVLIGRQFKRPIIFWGVILLMSLNVLFSVVEMGRGAREPISLLWESQQTFLIIVGLIIAGVTLLIGIDFLKLRTQLGTAATLYGCFTILSALGAGFLLGDAASLLVEVVLYALGIAMFIRLAAGRH